ncbi:hypothetical protein BKA82DRAFT_1004892 [Pisolithus tinctorius]|uniref:Uncharacterized protein n=1 Tax=Pisolithus tinctorius Marx 270 TaxID=870435 RepID=A0A0C3NBT1_PISTI|nr:hypothetical protein BKA82DRAFT_1004892 [Pisolithus tinctorius]KIN93305.1 hypothetical protein M404DRAFT_1009044 [Pisolithus tinctorius Marx 270]KIN99216.1 hypothetical protein M404DRAFT_1004892 [Pisolithus tinctorius Marx 270]
MASAECKHESSAVSEYIIAYCALYVLCRALYVLYRAYLCVSRALFFTQTERHRYQRQGLPETNGRDLLSPRWGQHSSACSRQRIILRVTRSENKHTIRTDRIDQDFRHPHGHRRGGDGLSSAVCCRLWSRRTVEGQTLAVLDRNSPFRSADIREHPGMFRA